MSDQLNEIDDTEANQAESYLLPEADMEDSDVIVIASMVSDINKFYDPGTLSWDEMDDEYKERVMSGVRVAIASPDLDPEHNHISWFNKMGADGWIFGEVKDAVAKTHPSMVPWVELHPSERIKNSMFLRMVKGCVDLICDSDEDRAALAESLMSSVGDYEEGTEVLDLSGSSENRPSSPEVDQTEEKSESPFDVIEKETIL